MPQIVADVMASAQKLTEKYFRAIADETRPEDIKGNEARDYYFSRLLNAIPINDNLAWFYILEPFNLYDFSVLDDHDNYKNLRRLIIEKQLFTEIPPSLFMKRKMNFAERFEKQAELEGNFDRSFTSIQDGRNLVNFLTFKMICKRFDSNDFAPKLRSSPKKKNHAKAIRHHEPKEYSELFINPEIGQEVKKILEANCYTQNGIWVEVPHQRKLPLAAFNTLSPLINDKNKKPKSKTAFYKEFGLEVPGYITIRSLSDPVKEDWEKPFKEIFKGLLEKYTPTR